MKPPGRGGGTGGNPGYLLTLASCLACLYVAGRRVHNATALLHARALSECVNTAGCGPPLMNSAPRYATQ